MWLHNVVITLKCCKEAWRISREKHTKLSTSCYIDILSILQNIEQSGVEPVSELVGLNVIYQHVFGEVIMVYLTPPKKSIYYSDFHVF